MDKESTIVLCIAVGAYAASALLALLRGNYGAAVVPILIGISLLGSSYSLAKSGKVQQPPILLFAAAIVGGMMVVAGIVLLFER